MAMRSITGVEVFRISLRNCGSMMYDACISRLAVPRGVRSHGQVCGENCRGNEVERDSPEAGYKVSNQRKTVVLYNKSVAVQSGAVKSQAAPSCT